VKQKELARNDVREQKEDAVGGKGVVWRNWGFNKKGRGGGGSVVIPKDILFNIDRGNDHGINPLASAVFSRSLKMKRRGEAGGKKLQTVTAIEKSDVRGSS